MYKSGAKLAVMTKYATRWSLQFEKTEQVKLHVDHLFTDFMENILF